MHRIISILDLAGVLQKNVTTPLVLSAGPLSTTIQEDHPDIVFFTSLCLLPLLKSYSSQQDRALAETDPTNNSTAIHARYSNLMEFTPSH